MPAEWKHNVVATLSVIETPAKSAASSPPSRKMFVRLVCAAIRLALQAVSIAKHPPLSAYVNASRPAATLKPLPELTNAPTC